MPNLSPHFSVAEAEYSTYALRHGIDNTMPDELKPNAAALCNEILEPLRDEVGPIHVDSLYRSKEVNDGVGSHDDSQHRLAEAADIVITGYTPAQVCAEVVSLDLPFDQLIEEFGWTHVSFSARNRRQKLRAVKVPLPNGKTKTSYVPVKSWE